MVRLFTESLIKSQPAGVGSLLSGRGMNSGEGQAKRSGGINVCPHNSTAVSAGGVYASAHTEVLFIILGERSC